MRIPGGAYNGGGEMTIVDKAINNNLRKDTIAYAYRGHIERAIKEAMFDLYMRLKPESNYAEFENELKKEVSE